MTKKQREKLTEYEAILERVKQLWISEQNTSSDKNLLK